MYLNRDNKSLEILLLLRVTKVRIDVRKNEGMIWETVYKELQT